MKITVQWKDPDYCNAETGEPVSATVSDADYESLSALGMREYVVIEFDTAAKTARVVTRK